MIDSVGGPQRMNNFLATLNLPTVNNKNLKVMERRAGEMIEKFADENMANESQKAFRDEMRCVYLYSCCYYQRNILLKSVLCS